MSDEQVSIEALIEASSLGTPEAKAARESVPHSTGVAIALAAKYLGQARGARAEALREAAEMIAHHARYVERQAQQYRLLHDTGGYLGQAEQMLRDRAAALDPQTAADMSGDTRGVGG